MTEDGVLGLSDRFRGVEASLDRIETKLDKKVDYEAFYPLIRRVELLESGETPLGRVLLKQFELIQQQVGEITLHGSANSQELVKDVATLTERVDRVEGTGQAARALQDAKSQHTVKTYRLWTLVFAMLSTASMVISAVALFVQH